MKKKRNDTGKVCFLYGPGKRAGRKGKNGSDQMFFIENVEKRKRSDETAYVF